MVTTSSTWPLLALLGVAGCTAPDSQAPSAARPPGPVAAPLPAAPRQPTRFDSLASARQVQQLLRTVPALAGIQLADSLPWPCADRLSCGRPGRVAGWSRADLDGNGRTDLLVTGSFPGSGRATRVLLDSGQRRLHPGWLGGYGDDCAVAQLVPMRGQAGIRYVHLRYPAPFSSPGPPRSVCLVDTLVFHEGQLVEYNPAPHDYRIERVEYSAGACFGTCPIYTLALTAAGAATYRAEEFVPRKGTFTATVPAPARQQLWHLLNYLDFPRLQDSYTLPITDMSTGTLTITYAGGRVKTITDYGQQGTLGLGRAYELLEVLRTSQRWK